MNDLNLCNCFVVLVGSSPSQRSEVTEQSVGLMLTHTFSSCASFHSNNVRQYDLKSTTQIIPKHHRSVVFLDVHMLYVTIHLFIHTKLRLCRHLTLLHSTHLKALLRMRLEHSRSDEAFTSWFFPCRPLSGNSRAAACLLYSL